MKAFKIEAYPNPYVSPAPAKRRVLRPGFNVAIEKRIIARRLNECREQMIAAGVKGVRETPFTPEDIKL